MTTTAAPMEPAFPARLGDRLGVVFPSRKLAFASKIFISNESYLRNAIHKLQLTNLATQCLFLDCAAIRDRSPNALTVEDAAAVTKLESAPLPEAVEEFGCVLAKHNSEFGLAFSYLGTFFEFITTECAYFAEMPDDVYFPPVNDSTEALFLPFKSFVTKSGSALQAVPKKDLAYYPLPGQFTASAVQSGVVSRPTANLTPQITKANARRDQLSEGCTTAPSTSGSSEGYFSRSDSSIIPNTLGAAASTVAVARASAVAVRPQTVQLGSQRQEAQRQSQLHGESFLESDTDARVNRKRKSGESGNVALATSSVVATARATTVKTLKPVKSKGSRKVVPQPFCVDDFTCVDVPNFKALVADGLEIRKEKWVGSLRGSIGWSSVWLEVQSQLTTFYMVPSANDVQPIVNVHLFEEPQFHFHLARNPVLCMEWHELWPLLQATGWVAQADGGSVVYIYPRGSGTFGLHKFRSKIALVRFIARYPYPLQADNVLMDTLRKNGWPYNPANNTFYTPEERSRSSYSLKEIRKMLWASPGRLFVSSCKQPEAFLNSQLCLSTEVAEEEEREPSSPEIDNMTSIQRRQLMKEIETLSNALSGRKSNLLKEERKEKEERFFSILQMFHWKHVAANWCTAWWQWEKVFVPPYARDISDRQPNADFFFTIEDVSIVLRAIPNALYYPPNASELKRLRLSNYNDSNAYDLNKRIDFILMNSLQPFQDYHLTEMLQLAGWRVMKDAPNKPQIFIPPHKTQLDITHKSLKQFTRQVDFCLGQNELIEYFMNKFGGAQCPSSPTSSLTSESSAEDPKGQHRGKSKALPGKVSGKGSPSQPASKRSRLSLGGAASSAMEHEHKQRGDPLHDTESGEGDDYWEEEEEEEEEEELESDVEKRWVCSELRAYVHSQPSFGRVLRFLEKIGWRTFYAGDRAELNVLCPPWTAEIADQQLASGLVKTKTSIRLTETMLRCVDYFALHDETADNVGDKPRLFEYLRRMKTYTKREPSVLHLLDVPTEWTKDIPLPEEAKFVQPKQPKPQATTAVTTTAVKKPKQPKQPKPLPVAMSPTTPSSVDSTQLIHQELDQLVREDKPYFPYILKRLEALGWKVYYSSTDGDRAVHVAPWAAAARDADFADEHAKKNKRILVLDCFEHLVDYFDDNDQDQKGRGHLIEYLRQHGALERNPAYREHVLREDPDEVKDRERGDNFIRQRSPMRALHKAMDPSDHVLRLVPPSDGADSSPLFTPDFVAALTSPEEHVHGRKAKKDVRAQRAHQDDQDDDDALLRTPMELDMGHSPENPLKSAYEEVFERSRPEGREGESAMRGEEDVDCEMDDIEPSFVPPTYFGFSQQVDAEFDDLDIRSLLSKNRSNVWEEGQEQVLRDILRRYFGWTYSSHTYKKGDKAMSFSALLRYLRKGTGLDANPSPSEASSPSSHNSRSARTGRSGR